MSDTLSPQPKQAHFLKCTAQQILYGGARGGGKGQPLSSPVLTPFGYRPMGSLRVGDVVSNPDGGTSRVIGIFPLGQRQIYKVSFGDGVSTRVTGDHLWLVRNSGGKTKSQKRYLHNQEDCRQWRVATTDELIAQIQRGPNQHASNLPLIPLTQPIRFCVTHRYAAAIDPYLLGLILGDGCVTGEAITVSSKDKEIQDELERHGFNVMPSTLKRCPAYSAVGQAKKSVKDALVSLKLMGCSSANKFIPKQFLYGSIETRKAVLSGLLDTDGYVEPSGKLYYTTVSKQLSNDVRFLVESLGGWCTTTSKIGTYKKHGKTIECAEAFTIYIQIHDRANLFKIERKRRRAERYAYNGGCEMFRKIVSIEEDGIEEAQCIRVDHPNSLYLTDNFIVTHNTFALIMKIQQHAELYGRSASMLVLRRTYPELEDFIKKSRSWLTAANGWLYKKGTRTFEHTSGAECKLRFLEDADSFQGHEYTLICVEEAGSFEDSEEIDKLVATQRSGDGVPCQLVMTANPGGSGNDWLRERFVDPAPDGFEMVPIPKTSMTRYYIPSTTKDNPALMQADPTYVERIAISGPPHLVKAWLEGDWHAAPLGSVWKFEYFENTWTYLPQFLHVVQAWDTAFKKTAKSDRSACTTWGVTRTHIYLLHAWAGKVEFPELKLMVKNLYGMWKPHVVYVEDRASGQSLIQEMKRDTLIPVKGVQVDIDKMARAYSVTPMFATGRVLVPHAENDWIHDYVSELCGFPKVKHDDYVDSTSLGISRLMHFVNQAEFFQSNVVAFQPGYYTA